MKKLRIDSKIKLIILLSCLLILIVSYTGLTFYNIHSLKRYEDQILPNTFLEEFDMSQYSYKSAAIKVNFYKEYILSKTLKVNINSKEYDYSFQDLGIEIDMDRTIENIKEYQRGLSYSRKLMIVNGKSPKVFPFLYRVDDTKLNEMLNNLKGQVDTAPIDGFFDTSNGVSYNKGVAGYSLNVEQSAQAIRDAFKNGLDEKQTVLLTGDVIAANGNESYAAIDTMTSGFVTDFMPNTYLRNINLNTALGYINGSVVEPGEVFSYCDKAGPFNKAGYVFYYEFVGNGVCQIATTTYNAALLGGLEIVKRYPHAKKSLYVDGGLDATVASYSGGWCVDMQFRNTYQYPIYIKAYSEGGRAHVEFWSNSNAKEGKEYTTESVRIGVRGYKSYLHTFKDGVEIDKHEIATTWYTEE